MMNDSIRVIRRPRLASPRTTRTAAAMIATAGLALLAAACASPSSTGPGGSSNAAVAATIQSTSSQKTLAYSGCMRSHGVPNFPGPDSSGQIPKETAQQLGVSDSRLQAAQGACQDLWPYREPSQAKPRPTGSDARNQPPQAKPRPTGSDAQNQPPQAKPSSGGGQ
jgi:hypothetical protein